MKKGLLVGLGVLLTLVGCMDKKKVEEPKVEDTKPKVEETKGGETATVPADCQYVFGEKEEGKKDYWTQTPDNCIVTVENEGNTIAIAKNQLIASFESEDEVAHYVEEFAKMGYKVVGQVGSEPNQVKELQFLAETDKTYDELLADGVKALDKLKDNGLKAVGLNILKADAAETTSTDK